MGMLIYDLKEIIKNACKNAGAFLFNIIMQESLQLNP